MANHSFLEFTPVPVRARHDGWSAEVQRGFVAGLARGLSPGQAARAVGMRRQGAYALRSRPGAESFAAAWDAAQRNARAERLGPLGAPAAALREVGVEVVRFRGAPPPQAPRAGQSNHQETAAFSALLDRICPAPGSEVRKADKADKADGKMLHTLNIVNFTRPRFSRDGRPPRD